MLKKKPKKMLVFPAILTNAVGLPEFQPDASFTFAMRFGAALMIGWTLLLIWGARKPVERRGVLLLTVIVIIGLLLSEMDAVASGFILLVEMLPTFCIQAGLIVLFLLGYRRAAKERGQG